MTKDEILTLKKNKKFSNTYIAGIDCSSTTVGWSVLYIDEDGEVTLDDYGYFDFDNDAPMYNRIVEFREHILPKIKKASYFVLEDRLKSMGGRTTAETLMKLAHVNATVETELKDMNGTDHVYMLHPMSARSCAWGQAYPKGKEKEKFRDTKEWVIDKCMKKFDKERGDRGFEQKTRSKRRPLPFKDWVDDICDSITLAYAIAN